MRSSSPSAKSPRPRPGDEHEVTIDRLAYGGAGVGRLLENGTPGRVAFVPRTAPADRVRVRLDKVQRRHAEATAIEFLEAGPGRIEPPCPHYEAGCGGCSWQHLEYPVQLAAKAAVVNDSLERIGGFHDLPIEPIVADEEAWYYRNKMDFSFHVTDGLGLHQAGDWRHVVPVSECRLESELAMRIVAFVAGFAERRQLSRWDPIAHEGFLRELVVRHGRNTGQTMVALVTAPGELAHADEFAAGVRALDDSIVSVLWATRGDRGGSPILSTTTLSGSDVIEERVGGRTFAIGLETFFQTNTRQAERMLEIVRKAVSEGLRRRVGSEHDLLIDVFCGVGFFTLCLADLVDEGVGVEIVEPSIIAARANAAANGVDNCAFYAGDARRTLPTILERHGDPVVVILDPPRGGAGGKVMRRIARAQPDRIVYVSCNPTTLARDLKELEPFGYRIDRVVPIDLFPQTFHVEAVVALDRDPTAVATDA